MQLLLPDFILINWKPACISKHCRPSSSCPIFQWKEVDATVGFLRAPMLNESQFFEQKGGNTLKSPVRKMILNASRGSSGS